MTEETTYYDRPVLKEHLWIWAVPAYFFIGGAAGAAATLGTVVEAFHPEGSSARLVRRCRALSVVGLGASTGLLIVDLGRPARFLNMLRVFRPSSPLSVGSWVLAAAAPANAGAAVLAGKGGFAGLLGRACSVGAGATGLPLTGYTAVLLANTAVPVWSEGATTLPPLFVSSAMASAASILELGELDEDEAAIVSRFGNLGRVAELIAAEVYERRVSRVDAVGEALRGGRGGMLWRAAKALGLGGLLVSLFGRSRASRRVSGALGVLSSLTLRWAVVDAGRMSSLEPRATFDLQRSQLPTAD